MSITQENAREYETDARTVGGYRISIRTTPTGYYRVSVDGPGQRPSLCDEIFTNLRSARIAINDYLLKNEATFRKQAVIEKVAGPKPPRKNVKSSSD